MSVHSEVVSQLGQVQAAVVNAACQPYDTYVSISIETAFFHHDLHFCRVLKIVI